MTSEQEYSLRITQKQADVIKDACELYSRLEMGQWDTVADFIRTPLEHMEIPLCEIREQLNDLAVKARMKPSRWAFRGITHDETHECGKIAWDVYQVLRHRVSWDRYPEGGMQVSFDKPFRTAKSVFAKIEKVID